MHPNVKVVVGKINHKKDKKKKNSFHDYQLSPLFGRIKAAFCAINCTNIDHFLCKMLTTLTFNIPTLFTQWYYLLVKYTKWYSKIWKVDKLITGTGTQSCTPTISSFVLRLETGNSSTSPETIYVSQIEGAKAPKHTIY